MLLEPKTLYVAPGGDDGAAGTETAPLGTLTGARERVRELLMTSLAPVTVTFRGGDYYFDASFSFGEADSGTAGAPVSYRAYPGERVRFLGGKIVPRNLIAAAESGDVLSRVSDQAASGDIFEAMAEFSTYSLTPAYYDITLMHKAVRDEESGPMIELILDSRNFDLGSIYDWGSTASTIRGLSDTGNIASKLQRMEKAAKKTLDKFIEAIGGN